MARKASRSSGEGLERSCAAHPSDWYHSFGPAEGVELLRAWFGGHAYDKHRHDTYAIGLTETGVQAFDYRGAAETSTPGKVVVLHPDEMHDGHAGSEAGFGYRMVYVEPARIAAALRSITGRPGPLPFVRQAVSTNGKLAAAVKAAFHTGLEPLAIDGLMVRLAEGLIDGDRGGVRAATPRRLDLAALARARQFLDAEKTRVVRSAELETVTGLTRYDLARQFRLLFGTSPYRYLLMRRLDFARKRIAPNRPLAQLALAAGFADQAHFSRMFKAAYGVTPARYGALKATEIPHPQ